MAGLRRRIQSYVPLLNVAYLATMGTICVYSAQRYMQQPLQPLLAPICLSIIFGVYVLNRFTDTKEDLANKVGVYHFFATKGFLLKAALGGIALAVVALAAAGQLRAYHLILVSAGILYSYRLVPWYRSGTGVVFVRLKELPFVKNLIVSFFWGSGVFVIPVLFARQPITGYPTLWILGISLAISTLGNTVYCDIRDEQGDRLAGNNTLPVVIGVQRTFGFLGVISGLWIVSAGILLALHVIDLPHLVCIVALALYPGVYIAADRRFHLPAAVVDLLCESDLMLFAGGLIVLSIS